MEVLAFAIQLALGVALTAWALRFDERRLPPRRLRRAWTPATFWSAVVAFGPLCVPVHFVRTRRTVAGFLLGLVWAAGLMIALGAADALMQALAALLGR